MIDEIKKFLDSSEEKLEFEHLCPDRLIDAAKDADMEVRENEIERNGWQLDYWIPAYYNGKRYELHGSAWYGDASIYISDTLY